MITTEHVGFNIVGFVGVVEDRQDPEKLGRVRVRALGFHTETKCDDDSGSSGGGGIFTEGSDTDQQIVPIGTDEVRSPSTGKKSSCIDTDQLPWATPALPNVYGAMNGIGMSSVGLLEGTWVFGVFLDGGHAQQPIILGVLPGRPECALRGGKESNESDECNELSIQAEGFFDPRSDKDLKDAPRPPKCIQPKNTCDPSSNTPTSGTSDGGGGNLVGLDGNEIVSIADDGLITLSHPDRGQFSLTRKEAIEAGYVGEEGGGGEGGDDKNCPLSFTGYKGQSHNPAQKDSDDDCLKKGLGEVSIDIQETSQAENYPQEGTQQYAYRTGSFKLEPDINRLTRNESIDKTIVTWKKENVDQQVPTAAYDGVSSLDRIPEKCNPKPGPGLPKFKKLNGPAPGGGPESPGEDTPDKCKSLGTKWDEPPTPYDAVYPYNRVLETESGHVEEWDDTPGAERYHRWHRAGTFTEIHPDGTRVDKIVGERYTIILTNDKVHIEANSDITIDKAAKILINADEQEGNHFDIEVGKGSCLNVKSPEGINLTTDKLTLNMPNGDLQLNLRNLNIKTSNDMTLDIGNDIIWRLSGCWESHVGGAWDTTVVGNYDLTVSGEMSNAILGEKFIQEVQGGEYIQRVKSTSYVICGDLMTEIGLGNITMNPVDRPGAVVFEIPPEPSCDPPGEDTPPPDDEPISDHPDKQPDGTFPDDNPPDDGGEIDPNNPPPGGTVGPGPATEGEGTVGPGPAINNPPVNRKTTPTPKTTQEQIDAARRAGATDEEIEKIIFGN